MSQSTFASLTSPSLTLLDQNFTQLYYLRELVSDGSYTAAAPKMMIAASGFIGMGTVAPDEALHVYSNTTDTTLKVENSTNDVQLQVNSTNGYLNSNGTGSFFVRMGVGLTTRFQIDASGHLLTGTDNTQTCGSAAKRFSVVYAGTGTINTSDAREKSIVQPLTPDELNAASELAREIGSFRFLDAVAAKGKGARLHIGLTVQRAMQILAEHGLDPLRYAFICHDQWPGDDATPAGDRYGFRPDELALFIARGLEARLAALEAAA